MREGENLFSEHPNPPSNPFFNRPSDKLSFSSWSHEHGMTMLTTLIGCGDRENKGIVILEGVVILNCYDSKEKRIPGRGQSLLMDSG